MQSTDVAVELGQDLEIKKKEVNDSKVSRPDAIKAPRCTPTVGTSKTKTDRMSDTNSNSSETKSRLTKPTLSSSLRTSGPVSVTRRSSTDGLPEKQPMSISKRQITDAGSVSSKRTSSLASDPLRKSLPELRRSPAPTIVAKPTTRTSVSDIRKSVPISPVPRTPRTPTFSDSSKQDSSKRSSLRSSQSSVSSVKKIASPSLDSPASSSSVRKSITKASSDSTRSPLTSSGSKSGGLSASTDRSSSLSGRKKVGTPDSRDSRLMMLPKVEVKASDDVVRILYIRSSQTQWCGINFSYD